MTTNDWYIILIAALPVIELRGSVPVALEVFNMPISRAFILSVIGNLLPIPFLWLFLKLASEKLRLKFTFVDKFLNWMFIRTEKSYKYGFAYWGWLVLAVFVAIPVPLTGAWSGTFAAFFFKMPFSKMIISISLGVIGAGIIMLGGTLGIARLFATI